MIMTMMMMVIPPITLPIVVTSGVTPKYCWAPPISISIIISISIRISIDISIIIDIIIIINSISIGISISITISDTEASHYFVEY